MSALEDARAVLERYAARTRVILDETSTRDDRDFMREQYAEHVLRLAPDLVRVLERLITEHEKKLEIIRTWAEENLDDIAHEGADTRQLLDILDKEDGS